MEAGGFNLKIDRTDLKIIEELKHDARLSMRELGKKVNLSAPSVTERVKKLECAGIITGYTIQIDRKKLGFAVDCLIEVTLKHGDFNHFKTFIKDYPGVVFCYRIAGHACYMMMFTAPTLNEIETFINSITSYAGTVTNVVFSQLETTDDLESHSPFLETGATN